MKLRSVRGFALLSLLVMLPLLLAVAGVVGASMLALRAHQEALHACRSSLLSAQANLASGLRQLTALNPLADRLRLEKTHAEMMAASAPDPVSEAYWQAQIVSLSIQQASLDREQRGLIALANLRARLAFERGRESIRAAYFTSAQRYGARGSGESSTPAGAAPSMQLERFPPLELAPRYAPSRTAENSQKTSFIWTMRPASLAPSWMPLDGINSRESATLAVRGDCAATVETKGDQWTPRLTATAAFAADKL